MCVSLSACGSQAGGPDLAPTAAYSLGVLLAKPDPPDEAGATAAYQRAIDSGHPEQAPMAAYNLGVLLAKQDPPDVTGATAAYQRAINSGHPGKHPWRWSTSRPYSRSRETTGRARILLGKAAQVGVVGAHAYAAALDDDPTVSERARVELGEMAAEGDTDELNFLGVLGWHSEARGEASAAWNKSREAGDVAAPLLLWLCGLPKA